MEVCIVPPAGHSITSTLGRHMTLTFDVLTPKPNQFIFVPRCAADKSLWRTSVHRYREMQHHERMDGHTQTQTDGRHKNIMHPAPSNGGGGINSRSTMPCHSGHFLKQQQQECWRSDEGVKRRAHMAGDRGGGGLLPQRESIGINPEKFENLNCCRVH